MKLLKKVPWLNFRGVGGGVSRSLSDPDGYCYHLKGVTVDVPAGDGLTALICSRRDIWEAVHSGLVQVSQVVEDLCDYYPTAGGVLG